MKTIFILLFLCSTSALFAQKHYMIPVAEADTNNLQLFRLHPKMLSVDVGWKKESWDTIQCTVTTLYDEDISNNPLYVKKETITTSIIELPLSETVKSAFNPDGTIMADKMNLILSYFGLKVTQ